MPYNFLMNTEGDIFAEHAVRFSNQWKQGLSRNSIEEKKKNMHTTRTTRTKNPPKLFGTKKIIEVCFIRKHYLIILILKCQI